MRHLQNFAAVGHSLPGFVPHGSEQTWALFRRYTGTLVRNKRMIGTYTCTTTLGDISGDFSIFHE